MVDLVANIVVEPYRERNDVFGYYIGINFLYEVNLRVILEFFQVRRREKCKPVALQHTLRKCVHHLNQCTVEHHRVICADFYQLMVNLVIKAIL